MTIRERMLAGLGALGLILGGAGCDCWCDGESSGCSAGPCESVIGSGVLATQSLEVNGFSRLSSGLALRLVVHQTGTESVTVTAEDNILPLLTAQVVGDQLLLGPRPGVSISPSREILYRVTCRDLTGVSLSGVSHAELNRVDAGSLLVEMSGASDAVASGRADTQEIRASGASVYHAPDLDSRVARVQLSGASRGVVRVRERLEVDASGASLLEYIGNPTLSVNTSGDSVVRQIGD